MPDRAREAGAAAGRRSGAAASCSASFPGYRIPRVTGPAFARAIATVLRQYVIPRVRSEVPVRTGRLMRSLRRCGSVVTKS